MKRLSSKRATLTILACLSLLLCALGITQIKTNTSPFFLEKTHPSRASHLAHEKVFARAGYSTYVLLETKQEQQIYNNTAVQELERLQADLESISLFELLPTDKISEKYALSRAQQTQLLRRESALELYNSLLQLTEIEANGIEGKGIKSRAQLNDDFGQYLFPIKSVKSLINTDNIYDFEDELIIEPSFVERDVWSKQDIANISENILLRGALFSENERGLIMQIEFRIDGENGTLSRALNDKIYMAVEEQMANSKIFDHAYYAGGPVIDNALSEVMERDNARYFPLVIVFVLLTLTLFYRSLRCALYGLAIGVASIIATLALMPMFGVTMNIVTTILPVFIITISVTDAIHVMSDVVNDDANKEGNANLSRDRKSNLQVVQHSIKKLFRPMLLTSITTAIGFMSISFTEIPSVRGLGIMVAVSVMIAFVLSVTLLPAILMRWPPLIRAPYNNQSLSKHIPYSERLNKWFSVFASRRVFPAIGLLMVTAFITGTGIPKLIVDQASIEAFDESSRIRQHNLKFVESGTGSVMLNVWLKSTENDAILQPEVLKATQHIQDAVEQHPFVEDSMSLVDSLERMHVVLEGENAEALDLSSSDRIRQYLFLLEGGSERDLESIVTVGDYQQTRILIALEQDNSAAISEVIDIINKELEGALPSNVSADFAGYAWMVYATAQEVLDAQVSSLISSLVAIFIVFALVFRSVATAIVGLTPLIATLSVIFGTMGHLGFSLDIGSTLFSGIAFGIGIDYAIHLIEALRRSKASNNRIEVIQNALGQVMLPISISALVLSSGFSLLMLSGFKSLASLGLLIMTAMLVSAAFTLIILPQILRYCPKSVFESITRNKLVPSATTNLKSIMLDAEAIEVSPTLEAIKGTSAEPEAR